MPIQWENITPNSQDNLIDPRKIYNTIDDRKWNRLRPEQSEVLDSWFKRRNERDLVIKQNTGSGKTLTGLLIALSSLREGFGPAVFLVPDNYLIQQVVAEANVDGIAVTTDENDLDFKSSRAILVTTFHKLFNGQSIFGVRDSKPSKINLRTIIIDDAHTAIRTSQSQFSVQITPEYPVFDKILNLFENELKHQNPRAYANIRDHQPGGPIRVPFDAVARHADDLMRIMQPITRDDTFQDIFFRWPLVADTLSYSIVTVTSDNIEIRPPCPDVSMITGFEKARRRIYLTATLENEDMLVTELGANPDSVKTPITPKLASDLGDRIILAPLEINPRIDTMAIHDLAQRFAVGDRRGTGPNPNEAVNVVVLVPSDRAAEAWSDVATVTLHVDDMQPYIERLRKGEHLGVVLLVNKYDGIDLPGNSCRLLIIDGVPTPETPHERRTAAALDGSETYKAREVQKLEQGIGRGTRDVSDYCAVLLLTNEAALTLHDPRARSYYSPATRAQIELSQQVSELIHGEGTSAIADLLDTFLKRDKKWITRSLKATAAVTYETENRVSKLATSRREAFNRMKNGDKVGAVDVLRKGIDSISDPQEKCWYMEELATYQYHISPIDAQRTLEAARRGNPSVLKPNETVTPRRKRKQQTSQAKAVSEYLMKFSDYTELELSVASIFSNIIWAVEKTSEAAEKNIQLLGSLLGFDSTRPEKEDRDGGPDNMWQMPDGQSIIIELKTEITRQNPVVIKSEAGQLIHSVTWFHDKYGKESRAIPMLVHPSSVLNHDAHLPSDSRIMTKDKLSELEQDVTEFIREIINDEKVSDVIAIDEGLKRHNLITKRIIDHHTVKATRR